MFKYVDYSNIKKSGGSREPLRFQSIDPLFYLSSFFITLSQRTRCLLASGFFPWQKKKGCRLRQPFQTVKKASQSSPHMRRIESQSIFARGVYVGENTYQAASVEFGCRRQINYARSRLQKTGGKARRVFRQARKAAVYGSLLQIRE